MRLRVIEIPRRNPQVAQNLHVLINVTLCVLMLRKTSFARLSPLAKGRIIGMRQAGMKRDAIRKKVKKKEFCRPSRPGLSQVITRS